MHTSVCILLLLSLTVTVGQEMVYGSADLIKIESPQIVLYFTDQRISDHVGILFKVSIHHMNFTSIEVPRILGPTAITYDVIGEYIYWTDVVTKEIRTTTKDGRNNTVVLQLNNTSLAEGLTHDSNTRQLFYTDRGERLIARIEMDTFETTVIINTRLGSPKGIIADMKNRILYWADPLSNNKIQACNYDGSQRRTVLSDYAVSPNGITLDEQTGRLYWGDSSGNVDSVLVDGTQRRKVFHKEGIAFNDISFFNGFLYLTMVNKTFLLGLPEDGKSYALLNSRKFEIPMGIYAFSPNYNMSGVCSDGRYGFKCELCGACRGGAICEKTTGTCLGGCSPGYVGFMCQRECPAGTFGERCQFPCTNCNTGTVCNHVTGKCPDGCQAGYRGDDCSEACGPNTYGNPCEDCGSCAAGARCDEVTGECPDGCLAGWTGPLCKTHDCPPNTYGACTPCGKCAGNSTCDTVAGTCALGCLPGWGEDRCDSECPPKTYGSCLPCGQCAGGAACDIVSGYCDKCQPGWEGRKCDSECRPNTYGNCIPCGHCAGDSPCNVTTGYCDNGCEDEWRGEKCDKESSDIVTRIPKKPDQGAPIDLVVGLSVLALLIIAAVVAIALYIMRRKKNHKEQTHVEMDGKIKL